MQLQVIKKDGTAEQYMHTKVLGTFNNALDDAGRTNIVAAEQFAEAVTFHLYHNIETPTIKSEDIHRLVVTVLKDTNYPDAASALNEHRLCRSVKRQRIEINSGSNSDDASRMTLWNKSRIAKKLIERHHMNGSLARAVASGVEEKIMNLNMRCIDHNLVKQLVIAETEILVKAQKQLEPASV